MDGSQKGKRGVFGFDMCLDDIKVIVFKEPVTLGAPRSIGRSRR